MKHWLGRNAARKGQFIVIAALVIALLVMATVLGIYQLAQDRQQLRYTSAKEILLSITTDLERALGYALSNSSLLYERLWWEQLDVLNAADRSNRTGHEFVSTWTRSILTSYSNLGARMGWGYPYTFNFEWGRVTTSPARGYSQVDTEFHLDLTGLGISGWVGKAAKRVQLTLYPESITVNGLESTFMFSLDKEWDRTIDNLSEEDIKDIKVEYGYADKPWVPPVLRHAKVVPGGLKYLGNGAY
ncbi:MAG: hypothetical protein QW587_01710, partial [Candidatus Bathyarchaeia archaeon]